MTLETLSANTVLNQLQWRYAVKKFDSTQKIPDAVWSLLEKSLVLTPSSFGLQPWKFFVITNSTLQQQLVEHSWGQNQVAEASHLVVFTIKTDLNTVDVERYVQYMAQVQNTTPEKLGGFANMVKGFIERSPEEFDVNIWSTKQVYIALGQFMTCAAMLGIDTCPMEGFVPDKYDRILGLTEKGYRSVVLCPAGYRAQDDKYSTLPKVRYPKEEVVEHIEP